MQINTCTYKLSMITQRKWACELGDEVLNLSRIPTGDAHTY